MRVMGLGKTFNRYPFGIKSSKDKIALTDIYFEVFTYKLSRNNFNCFFYSFRLMEVN